MEAKKNFHPRKSNYNFFCYFLNFKKLTLCRLTFYISKSIEVDVKIIIQRGGRECMREIKRRQTFVYANYIPFCPIHFSTIHIFDQLETELLEFKSFLLNYFDSRVSNVLCTFLIKILKWSTFRGGGTTRKAEKCRVSINQENWLPPILVARIPLETYRSHPSIPLGSSLA